MPTTSDVSEQERRYQQASTEYGPALARLARGYEADPDRRLDLLQEIHLALWRSFAAFDGRCSERTWIYRVAHNTAVTWITRQRRARPLLLLSLDEVQEPFAPPGSDRNEALERITQLIQRLKPIDRQVILAWLEGMDAAAIGELTGLAAGNVATKVHRIKHLLARSFHDGGPHV